MCELRRHVYANTVDRSTIKKLINWAFPRCECRNLHQKQITHHERLINEETWMDEEDEFGSTFDSNLEAELKTAEMKYCGVCIIINSLK